jgi:hypothetical protein
MRGLNLCNRPALQQAGGDMHCINFTAAWHNIACQLSVGPLPPDPEWTAVSIGAWLNQCVNYGFGRQSLTAFRVRLDSHHRKELRYGTV